MKSSNIRFAGLAVALMVVLIGTSSMWSQDAQSTRLAVRRNRVINGVEAQLRGDYRADGAPTSLNSQLENIGVPIGVPIAFCLVQNGVSTRLGVGKVALVGGQRTATVELSARDGDIVPTVNAGDILVARQSAKPPFQANPGCGAPVLIGGFFN
jgi:hypothetical protein